MRMASQIGPLLQQMLTTGVIQDRSQCPTAASPSSHLRSDNTHTIRNPLHITKKRHPFRHLRVSRENLGILGEYTETRHAVTLPEISCDIPRRQFEGSQIICQTGRLRHTSRFESLQSGGKTTYRSNNRKNQESTFCNHFVKRCIPIKIIYILVC